MSEAAKACLCEQGISRIDHILAPGVFELDSENKAVVYNEKGADAETTLLAAKSCPTQAILVFDDQGNQIFP